MLLQLVRALWGVLLLLAPRSLLDRVGNSSRAVAHVTRILGARHLAEVVILSRRRGRVPPRWPVLVDVAHGATMVAVAICSRRFRRDALASAGAAGLLAGWTEVERRHARG